MGRSALTFAEIFIVLSLVFLIQTIANFNLYEGLAEEPPVELVLLSLRQVPSGADETDHLRYLKFSGGGFEQVVQFQGRRPRASATSRLPAPLRSALQAILNARRGGGGGGGCEPTPVALLTRYIDAKGACRQRPALAPEAVSHWSLPAQREAFVKLLALDLRIHLSRVDVANTQPEYVLSWVPEEIAPDTTLTIGLEHCFLNNEEENLRIDPAWKVDAGLDYPHPLILTRTAYRQRIEVEPPIIHYAHSQQLPDPLTKLTVSTSSGLVMGGRHEACQLDGIPRDEVRCHAYVEFSMLLGAGGS